MVSLQELKVPVYFRRVISSYLTEHSLLYNTDTDMLLLKDHWGRSAGLGSKTPALERRLRRPPEVVSSRWGVDGSIRR